MKTRKLTLATLLLALLLSAFSLTAQAQQRAETPNYALIDMQYILSSIPEHKNALKTIEEQTKQWSEEIKKLEGKAKERYLAYQKEASQLTQDKRVARENEIVALEEQAIELQRKYFGPKGEAVKLQEKLVKPVQDKVYEAVKLISQKRGYLIVFDRASAVGTIIYADPMADISNDVLTVLGYSN